MNYTFIDPKTGKKYDDLVYIPTEIFCTAIRKFVDYYYDVTLDGRDKDILSFLSAFEDGTEYFADNDDFIELCKELYKDSSYYDDDLDEVIEAWTEED